jgi:hypothetical protein
MSVHLEESDGGKVVRVQLSGKLTHGDYQHFVPAFEAQVQKHGKIRVLVEMVDFHGWEAAALWEDIKFDIRHFSNIERLAMVGDKAWERGMSTFCKPFTAAEVRYFDRSAIKDASAWLAVK